MATQETHSNPSPPRRATFAKRRDYVADGHRLHSYLVGRGDDSARVTRAAQESIADVW